MIRRGRFPMFRGIVQGVACAVLACGPIASGLAEDRVSLVLDNGERHTGTVLVLSPDTIQIETRGQNRPKFNTALVREVIFDGEPDSLGDARGLLRRREPRAALKELAKIDPADIKAAAPRVRDEYGYLKLLATARASSAAEAAAAAEGLKTFLGNNLSSHHFYEGQETLGDLLGRLGKFDEAAKAYGELNRGPPALRIRGTASKARLLLQGGKAADALKEFEAATRIWTEEDEQEDYEKQLKDAGDIKEREKREELKAKLKARQELAPMASAEKRKAELGMARCLARLGKASEGIAAARATIRKLEPGQREGLAIAYATLGQCQRAAGGKDEDALVSFLTVDLVYNSVPEAHAEALYNLVELWESAKKPERGREARQALLTTYPQSSWTRKLGGGKAS